MLRSNPFDPTSGEAAPDGDARFVLYVEGPSDCYILKTWAGLVSRPLAHELARSAVILGGRRPARALEHYGALLEGEVAGLLRGICVLDRDGHAGDIAGDRPEGLDFFTWPRRHIESYLLVPSAMRRALRMSSGDPRLHDLVGDLVADDSEERLRTLDAKRLLSSRSALARELGASLSPARIARCMNRGDLHPDVLGLLDRLRSSLLAVDGVAQDGRRNRSSGGARLS